MLEVYDSGFVYDTTADETSQFISNRLLENDDFKWMNLFDVCVRKGAR